MKCRLHKRSRSIRKGSILGEITLGLIQRPGDEQRAADDVPARYEAPVATVETVVAVVAHGEVAILGDDQVAAFEMLSQSCRPVRKPAVVASGFAVERKVVTSRRIIPPADHKGLSLPHFVPVNHAGFQMNLVTGNSNDAFDQIKSRLARGGEDRYVAAVNFPVGHKVAGDALFSRWREPVHK